MPASSRSLLVTDAYRNRLGAIRERTQRLAEQSWPTIDELDGNDWAERMAPALAQAQAEAVRVSTAYLQAFVSSEIGRSHRGPVLDSRDYAGVSRDGRPIVEALSSPLIGTLGALKEGRDPDEALKLGRVRALRMVEQSLMHAARVSLNDGMKVDGQVKGWQRAVAGTCGACMGSIAVEVSVQLPEIPLMVHPNCQCVTQPVVVGRPQIFPMPTGQERFKAMTPAEQDEALGPDVAQALRSEDVQLEDLVEHSKQATGDDFITQAPLPPEAARTTSDVPERKEKAEDKADRKFQGEAPGFGFNDDLDNWLSTLRQAKKVGANEARIPVAWNNADHAKLGEFYNLALAKNITPIFTVWTQKMPPVAEWRETCADFARRYPKATIQLLNEPNLPGLGAPEGGPGHSPEVIAEYVRAGYEAIRAVNPKQEVMGPPMAPVGKWTDKMVSTYKLLGDLDLTLTMNLYPPKKNPLQWLVAQMRLAKTLGFPIAITELGFLEMWHGKHSDELSAQAYKLLSKLGAESIIFHRLRRPADATTPTGAEASDRELTFWQTWLIGAGGKRSDLWKALRAARKADLKRRR